MINFLVEMAIIRLLVSKTMLSIIIGLDKVCVHEDDGNPQLLLQSKSHFPKDDQSHLQLSSRNSLK